MRGLTAKEYVTLTFAAEHSVEEYSDDMFVRFTTVTDAGRSALKIHRALMAMEGLGI